MKLTRLHEISADKKYDFKYDEKTGITIYTSKNKDISFRIKKIPDGIVFKNKGEVKLELIRKLPKNVVFENKGNVILGDETEIPEGYCYFKNYGNLIPENTKFKEPKVRYFFSEEFTYFLQENSKNKWIAKLAKINNSFIEEDDEFQASFIDCQDDVSYLPLKEVFKKYQANLKTEAHKSIEHYLSVYKHNLLKDGLKNKIKMGRFVKRLFPEMTDPEVEEVVNIYKGFQNSKDCGLEVVRGEQIVHFYNRNFQTAGSSGRLANSCMNYNNDKDERYRNLHFYASIPNCGLLILRDPKNSEKIIGRALIWSANNGKTYVDSIYTAKEADLYIYRRYIKMNGCLAYVNSDSCKDLVIDCPEETSKLEHYMPYLDTMRYDKKKNKVYSNR